MFSGVRLSGQRYLTIDNVLLVFCCRLKLQVHVLKQLGLITCICQLFTSINIGFYFS